MPLPARELRGVAVEERYEAEELGAFTDPLLDLRLGAPLHAETKTDVAAHRHVGEDRVALEDHRDIPVPRREVGHVPLADLDVAAVHLLEARDAAQQRRLPTPGRTQKDHEFAVTDVERDVLEGGRLPEDLADAVDRDARHQRDPHRFIRYFRMRKMKATAGNAMKSPPANLKPSGEVPRPAST